MRWNALLLRIVDFVIECLDAVLLILGRESLYKP